MPKKGKKGGANTGQTAAPKPEKSQFQHLLDSFLVEVDIPETLQQSFPNIKIHQRFIPGICRFAPPNKISKYSTFNSRSSLIKWTQLEEKGGSKFGTGTVQNTNGTVEEKRVFVKTIHLLDPFNFVKGEYGNTETEAVNWVPNLEESYDEHQKKLNSMYNQAYIDAIAQAVLGRLKEENITPHALYSYGMVVGTHQSYWYDITNDYESLRERKWFWDTIGDDAGCLRFCNKDGEAIDVQLEKRLKEKPDELYDSDYDDEEEGWETDEGEGEGEDESADATDASSSGDEKNAMTATAAIDSAQDADSVISADSLPLIEEIAVDLNAEPELIEECQSIKSAKTANTLKITRRSNNTQSSNPLYDDENIGIRILIECKNMPVLMLFQEAADGTMDQLVEEEESVMNSLLSPGSQLGDRFTMSDSIENMTLLLTDEKDRRWAAWLFQIVAALTQLQSLLSFCHNDLHTNNIVWTKTSLEYIHYKRTNGTFFKVPTYGKLFHIIDFGRATFSIGDRMFMSDDFFEGNDAFGQYNYGACFTPDRPILYPNMSFDLCRLAVSLIDSLYNSTPEVASKSNAKLLNVEGRWKKYETSSTLYNMIWRWLIDDKNRNVLRSADGEDRFPGFDLYVHIAKHVHSAVPKDQLGDDAFAQFMTPHSHPAAVQIYA